MTIITVWIERDYNVVCQIILLRDTPKHNYLLCKQIIILCTIGWMDGKMNDWMDS